MAGTLEEGRKAVVVEVGAALRLRDGEACWRERVRCQKI